MFSGACRGVGTGFIPQHNYLPALLLESMDPCLHLNVHNLLLHLRSTIHDYTYIPASMTTAPKDPGSTTTLHCIYSTTNPRPYPALKLSHSSLLPVLLPLLPHHPPLGLHRLPCLHPGLGNPLLTLTL